MIFTEEHLEAGMSSNGFWSMKQLRLLDVNHKRSGWKDRAIGRDYPESVINEFVSLKDAHLIDGKNCVQLKQEQKRAKKAGKPETIKVTWATGRPAEVNKSYLCTIYDPNADMRLLDWCLWDGEKWRAVDEDLSFGLIFEGFTVLAWTDDLTPYSL